MAMPSALIGFAYFKLVSRLLSYPFTPVENVLVQSVAGSVGTMPLGCGFVGVIPALEFLLKPKENGPLSISLWKLIVWAVGICFFGVVFAVPLRREVIIREKLKFPSGTATALMIGVLHGEKGDAGLMLQQSRDLPLRGQEDESDRLLPADTADRSLELSRTRSSRDAGQGDEVELGATDHDDWKVKIKLLTVSFGISALYTVVSYFIPQLRDLPIFGLPLAHNWLWTFNPSPAYVAQGIIMGPSTTLHMLFGAIIGWGVLSPLAKSKGWAPGPVSDWTTGSKGWIVWVSLAIMLADSFVSLGWVILRPTMSIIRDYYPEARRAFQEHSWKEIFTFQIRLNKGYSALRPIITPNDLSLTKSVTNGPEEDAPPEHLISTRTTLIGLILSLSLCIAAVHYSFAGLIPLLLTLLALVLALLLSVMGVRALGETDLNPVSGISKLTQLLFALVTPRGSKNAIIVNLLAGALSESGALQAGDLMQDLKAGHLLGAAPSAQFYGQLIGSAVGAVLSAGVYRLYTNVYQVPGGQFQIPTGYVWVFTARLVTGQGLPPMVPEWALGAGVLFAVTTTVRTWGARTGWGGVRFVPGGIAVAVGMYNVPSFTLARTIGGLIHLYWHTYLGREETPVIILASGLILGEGLFSIVNLLLASFGVPHL
ncbi:OPT superfamily oligopeptide transporter [Patellaria atrata CBS 101060]|uniref:OPT superfamily oligopeptide transporter n=1 Tax=Patellaria atrata CBS 101060 TaxID=1346257 RepID=A0A9P4SCJ4_9PEZI|nr:OPT superfamily oligopeptide transporter [Patellaria atrata CBS 101060]